MIFYASIRRELAQNFTAVLIVLLSIVMTMMLKGKEPGNELRMVINVFAFLSSAWYSVALYRKEKHFRS